ncbi:MAG: hypothetical protein HUU20_09930 [Pirellulales bacterium]|nr:hypothetical protein [Pirellulales bacterium]
MNTNTCSYPPVVCEEYLDRLAVFQPQADAEVQIWMEVHELVQRILAQLDGLVKISVPDLRVQVARTRGRHFHLFTYRTFLRADRPEIDPVIVGLTFVRGGDENREAVAIEADVSGEQAGDRIAVTARREVPPVREELVRAARELATELSGYAPLIAEALLDTSRAT